MSTFESRAKLMLTGEYSVLQGALALAVPLRFGQHMTVLEREDAPKLIWNSIVCNQYWFSAEFSLPELAILKTNLPQIGQRLRAILQLAKVLNPKFLRSSLQYSVTCHMDFYPEWGLGSSSSLLSNIAHWAACDPFELNQQIFKGSGYDIACARASTPLLYAVKNGERTIKGIDFHPIFHQNLHFIYLNRKQDSRMSIQKMAALSFDPSSTEAISSISKEMIVCSNLESFQSLMKAHEDITGQLTKQIPIQKERFKDFNGTIKSLGGWGGDFILAASPAPEEYVQEYFSRQQLPVRFNYNAIVWDREISCEQSNRSTSPLTYSTT